MKPLGCHVNFASLRETRSIPDSMKIPKIEFIAYIYILLLISKLLLDFSNTVKAEPHECVIRTGQP